MTSRVLLTGATGCLGRALLARTPGWAHVTALVEPGDDRGPVGADRVVEGTLADCGRWAPSVEVERIIHLAALVHHEPRTRAEEERFFEVNAEGTRRLLGAFADRRLRHVLLASTIAVYGEGSFAADERTEPDPATPYARSKLKAEEIVREAAGTLGFSPCILRLSTLYGRGDRGNVAGLARAVARGLFFVPGKGEVRKSLLYSGNAAAVLWACAERGVSGTFNVADGPPVTLAFLADMLAAAFSRRRPRRLPMPLAWGIAAAGSAVHGLLRVPVPLTIRRLRKLVTETAVVGATLPKGVEPPLKDMSTALHETFR